MKRTTPVLVVNSIRRARTVKGHEIDPETGKPNYNKPIHGEAYNIGFFIVCDVRRVTLGQASMTYAADEVPPVEIGQRFPLTFLNIQPKPDGDA